MNPGKLFPSKYYLVKHQFIDKVQKVVEEGDIFCRLGNAKIFDLLPFSWIVSGATLSQYSHAAMVVEKTDNQIFIADVSTYGMTKQRVEDWLNDCIGPFVCVLRVKDQYKSSVPIAVNIVKNWFNHNIQYNHIFRDVSNEEVPSVLYCTQMVYEAYRRAGLKLNKAEIKFSEVFPRNSITNVIISIAEKYFNLKWEDLTTIVVGNENFGLLACAELMKICEFYSDNARLFVLYDYFEQSKI
jgi:hypothetical protein